MLDPFPAVPGAQSRLPTVLLAFQIHFPLSLNEFKVTFGIYIPPKKQNKKLTTKPLIVVLHNNTVFC